MLINNVQDFESALKNGPYAWPGGYPLFFIAEDGGVLSFKAAEEEQAEIREAIQDDDTGSGWRVVAVDINYEDTALFCDHTGIIIESAYGE